MSLLKDKIEIQIEEAELTTQKELNSLPKVLKWLIIATVILTIPLYFTIRKISASVSYKKLNFQPFLAKASFENPEDLKWDKVSVTTMGANTYGAAVNVENPNLNLSADNVSFVFNFYNSKKELLYTFKGKTFFLPDQSKYLIAPKFTTASAVSYTEFGFPEGVNWQKRLNTPKVEIVTSSLNAYHEFSPEAFVLEGDFTNKSPYALKNVRLTFLLFDKENRIIGVSSREESTIAPFERRSYKQLWPNVFAQNLYDAKVFAETDTLDLNNLSAPPVPTGSSSDLSRPTPTR